jgi:hypothetical protein
VKTIKAYPIDRKLVDDGDSFSPDNRWLATKSGDDEYSFGI